MARMQRSLFAQLNALAEEISQSKTAAEKSAGPVPSDPGGYMGASSHPSAHADNRVQDAPEGARMREYESDIKEQQGALSVDNTPEMSQEGRQDDVQLNLNTNSSAVGEDPAVEKDYKGTKDDPGTSHPAKTTDGEKYGSVSFKEARAMCGDLGNDILANLINFGAGKLTKQSEMPAALKQHKEDKNEKDTKGNKGNLKGDQHKLDVDHDGKIEGSDLAALRAGKEAAFKAGYEIAAAAGVEKNAAEAAVREVCANTLRDTDVMADLLLGFLSGQKRANDALEESVEGEDHNAPGDASSGASDAPPGLEAMMAGGGDEMGGDMGGEMGGMGEPSEEEAVQELAMALEELGISPEELMAAVGGGDAGMGGAPAPAMEPKMAAARDLNDIGRAVINFKRAGRFQVKEARTKRARELRDNMKQHVIELLNR